MQALMVNDYGLHSNMKGYLLFASSMGSLGMIKNIAQHLMSGKLLAINMGTS